MIALYFDPSKFPRTITRKEWRGIWRWKRVIEKQLAAEVKLRMQNLAIFGTSHPEIVADIIDNAINPPLLIHDRMER